MSVISGGMVAAKPHLTGPEFVAALEALDIEQNQFASIIGTDGRTVRRWVQSGVPGYASLLIRMLLARPELMQLINAPARTGRGRPPKTADERAGRGAKRKRATKKAA